MEWRFGSAKTDITPMTAQWLSGMGYRLEKSKGVYLPLLAEALFLTDGRLEALLINADLIDFPRDMVRSLRRVLAQRLGLPGDHVIFSATHSHDTPRISDAIALPGQMDPEYVSSLRRSLVDLTGGAAVREHGQAA